MKLEKGFYVTRGPETELIGKYLRYYLRAQDVGYLLRRPLKAIEIRIARKELAVVRNSNDEFQAGFLVKTLANNISYIEAYCGSRANLDLLATVVKTVFGTCYFHINKSNLRNIEQANIRATAVSSEPGFIYDHTHGCFGDDWLLYRFGDL